MSQVGQNVQYITGTVTGEAPTVTAAVITDVCGPDTMGLTVFPGPAADTAAFSKSEINAGIAQRTLVVRGKDVGCWRPIPAPRDTAGESEVPGQTDGPGPGEAA